MTLFQISVRDQYAHRYREFERGSLFPQVRRRQVYRYLLWRELETAVLYRRDDPVPALLYRGIRKADYCKTRQAPAHINLYLHFLRFDPKHSPALDFRSEERRVGKEC